MTAQHSHTNNRKIGTHAIVVGGSLAGLLATRVLSDHFDKVTAIERDRFPDGNENRKGVPQGRHAHGLLASGFRVMTSLFPGLQDELVQTGAIPGDVVGDARWYQFGGYKAKFQSGLGGILLSRPLLESTIRRRVLSLPNVQARETCSVLGLIVSPDRSRVTGVRLEHKTNGGEEELLADLVVDAGGRGSRSPAWLEALGYDRPTEEEIKIGVGYATRIYRRRPQDLSGDMAAIIAPMPPLEKRMGVILAIEGDRWIVSIGGWLGDHPPIDEPGYLEFARSLPAPDIYEVIKDAEPLSEIMVHKFPSNLRRHYERLTRFPEGYLVIGDAMCSFNPIYGQGMSVAALEALALRDCLNKQPAGSLTGLPHRFFKRAAKVIDIPWTLAAGADFNYPEVEGKRPAGTDFINWYVGQVHQVAMHDREVCRAFFEVANLLKPPTSLFHPAMVLRVLRGSLTGRHKTARSHTDVRQHPELAVN
jgi:2-polyprenyl-6-methoxyphenol hydroxylase-like FAD-dependent oxidoreductase